MYSEKRDTLIHTIDEFKKLGYHRFEITEQRFELRSPEGEKWTSDEVKRSFEFYNHCVDGETVYTSSDGDTSDDIADEYIRRQGHAYIERGYCGYYLRGEIVRLLASSDDYEDGDYIDEYFPSNV